MRVRRTSAAVWAVLPLLLVATACSDSSGGLVTGSDGSFSQSVADPTQGSDECHSFTRGVTRVTNDTGVDIWLHKGPGCTDPAGRPSVYLPKGFTGNTDGTPGRWQGFTTVGWPPPVSVS